MVSPYQDRTKSIPERVQDLLTRMTIDEKIAQMHAFWLILSEDGCHQMRSNDEFTRSSDPGRLQRLLGYGLGQITRPLGSHGVDPRQGVRALNRLQPQREDEIAAKDRKERKKRRTADLRRS
jgi:hypothetical protein